MIIPLFLSLFIVVSSYANIHDHIEATQQAIEHIRSYNLDQNDVHLSAVLKFLNHHLEHQIELSKLPEYGPNSFSNLSMFSILYIILSFFLEFSGCTVLVYGFTVLFSDRGPASKPDISRNSKKSDSFRYFRPKYALPYAIVVSLITVVSLHIWPFFGLSSILLFLVRFSSSMLVIAQIYWWLFPSLGNQSSLRKTLVSSRESTPNKEKTPSGPSSTFSASNSSSPFASLTNSQLILKNVQAAYSRHNPSTT